MSKSKRSIWIGALLLCTVGAAAHGWVTEFPVGVTINDPTQVTPGFVVFNANTGQTYAVSTTGALVKAWNSPEPSLPLLGFTEPTRDGTLLAYVSDGPKPGCAVNCGDRIVEMDLAGNMVWSYIDNERFLHHDFERLENGNTMILCSREIMDLDVSDKLLIDDCIIEVDPAGNVVWEWQTADHYDEIGLSQQAKDLIFAAGGDWGHANGAGVIPENTSIPDPRFRPGNVFVQYQSANLLIVVDRDTGEIVWSMKDVAISPHGINIITDGKPGAGHLLLLDNGSISGYPKTGRTWSRVIEIDPVDDSIPYEYTATDSGSPQVWSFWSHFKGTAQRFANGNTMITEGSTGRVFEVNAAGEIVWEFVNPASTGGNDIYRAFKITAGGALFAE